MTKILTKVPCTDCGHESETVIDLDKLARMVPSKEEKPAPAPEPKEKHVYPTWFPRRSCGTVGCKEEHPNDNYSQRVKKKCNGLDGDCGQFLPAASVRCPWCNSKDSRGDDIPEAERFDDIDEDILEKIPQPGGHSHD